MDWVEPAEEEMYISNFPPENMRLNVALFSVPPKSSPDPPETHSKVFKWKSQINEGRLISSLTDLKANPISGFENITINAEAKFTEKMYIYANLAKNPENEQQELVEILRIRTDGNGHYWFKPDLTGSRPPYRIPPFASASIFTNQEWRYKIEGIQVGPAHGFQDEKSVLPPQITWTESHPMNGIVKVHVFGEVLSATGFEYPTISVTIRNSLDSQHVVTHSVSPRDGIRKYSYPFTFEFAMKEGSRYPELFIEAISFGFFNNRRIEGYGYGMIPEEAGKHDVEVKCWRPQMGVQDELRRFFLGGTGELVSLNPIGINPYSSSNKFSRLGLNTTTTGSVTVRLRIAKHYHKTSKKKSISRLPAESSKEDVLEKFQKVRDQMIRNRRAVPKHIISS